MKKIRFFLLIAALGICLIVLSKNNSSAESAIVHFHDQYNAGKLDSIWDEAHSKLRDAFLSKDKFSNYMEEAQTKFGEVKSSARLSKREVNILSWTRKIAIVQKTVFEKGTGTETFTFEFIDHKAWLIGYEIH